MAFGSRLSNNSLLFCVITALCFGMGFSSRVAAQPLILDKDIRQLNLAPAVEIFKDKTGQLTLQDIRNPSIQAQFQPSNTAAHQEINFGFTTDTYWLKVTLVRTAEAEADWILEIPYLNLNSVTFFAPNQKAIQVGTDYSADNKPIFYPLYALPLKLYKFKHILDFLKEESLEFKPVH